MPTTPRRINLTQLKVNSPCPVSWDTMRGDERARFCDHCGLQVHNLSAMTRDEAQQLVCSAAGRLCVAYVPSAQGTVTTLEYHRQTRPKYRWRWVAALAAVGALSSGVVAAVLRPWARQITAPPPMIAGSIAPPPSTQPIRGELILGDVMIPATQPTSQSGASTEPSPTRLDPDVVNCTRE